MASFAKKLVGRTVPRVLKEVLWCVTDSKYRHEYLATRHRIRKLKQHQTRALKQIAQQIGQRVVTGPFAGMQYFARWHKHLFPQKLLGTYEKELWPVLESICTTKYARVVDIGAAEGYYVAGLARRIPTCKVVAFEADTPHHRLIQEIANLNGVADRIEVKGFCGVQDLQAVLQPSCAATLIVCDVEGAEFHLLDPVIVPELQQCDLLIEVHNHCYPGLTDILRKRFAQSHHMECIRSIPRSPDDFPPRIELEVSLQLASMDECRGFPMDWLWLKAKESASA